MKASSPLLYPLPRFLFILMGGIALAIMFPGLVSVKICGVIILVLIVALLMLIQMKNHDELLAILSGGCAGLIVFMGGISLTILADPRSKEDFFARYPFKALIGICKEDCVEYRTMIRFRMEVQHVDFSGEKSNKFTSLSRKTEKKETHNQNHKWERASGNVFVYIKNPCLSIAFGDMLLLKGKLSPILPPISPHSFDQKKYLEYHQVYQNYFCKAESVVLIRHQNFFTLRRTALKVQKTCASIFNVSMPDTAASSFLSALLLGSRGNIDPDLYKAFSNTGTVHIISVSGLHVQIVYAVFAWLIPAGIFRKKWKNLIILRRIILALFIWFYALISGFSPAVLRSAVMISFFIMAEGIPRKLPGSMVYFTSAMCILLVDPWALADMGFQLSYLAVGSLMAFQQKIYHFIAFENKIMKGLWNMCSTSLAAQVLTFPLCLFYFHQYPTYFLFANLLIIPITSVMLYIGIFQLAVCGFGSLLALNMHKWLICRFMEQIYHVMTWLLLKTGSLPFASLNGYYPLFSTIILFYILILLCYSLFQKANKLTFCFSSVLLIILLAQNLMKQYSHLSNNKELHLKLRGKIIQILFKGRCGTIISESLDKKEYQRYILPECQANGIQKITYLKCAIREDP